MSLALTLLDGLGVQHVYTDDDGLLFRRRALSESLRGDTVEVGNVDLDFYGSAGTGFLGATGRDDLPAPSLGASPGGGYRAVIERSEAGVPVAAFEGVVMRGDVVHDPLTGVWAFPFLGAAEEDFRNRLADVRLRALPGIAALSALRHREGGYYYRDTNLSAERYFVHPGVLRYYDLRSVLEALVLATASSLAEPLPFPTWTYGYVSATDGVTTRTEPYEPYVVSRESYDATQPYGPTNLTLPDLTGAEFFDAALEHFGWRLAVAYEPYPSTALAVRVLPDAWASTDPSALTALDDRIEAGGYSRLAEASTDASGTFRYPGVARRTSPAVSLSEKVPASTETYGAVPAPPPPQALLAQSRWRFEAPRRAGDEPVPVSEPVTAATLDLPAVVVESEAVATLPDLHADYERVVVSGRPYVPGEGAFVVTLTAGEGGAVPVHAHYLRIADGAGPGFLQNGPLWAGQLLAARALSRLPLEIADGTAILPASATDPAVLAVGVPSRGIALEGRAWMLRERRLDLDSALMDFEAVRPHDDALATAPGEPPEAGGAVQNLALLRVGVATSSSNPFDNFVATWEPPPLRSADVLYYEVQTTNYESGDPVPAWGQLRRVYGTAYLVGFRTFLTVALRVRAVASSTRGPWVTVTNTPEERT